ncbi:Protein kinase domain containing protein [Aphelenchoides avenae]|nr:Protein kinase domain containing protein [Aphelenchus avenae]
MPVNEDAQGEGSTKGPNNMDANKTLQPAAVTHNPTVYSAMNTVVKLRDGNPVEKLKEARQMAAETARLPTGTEITTSKAKYRIDRHIHEGTFGFTTEPLSTDEYLQKFKVLKGELLLLQTIGKEDAVRRRQFVQLIDAGSGENMKFYVTNLLGDNLYTITRVILRRSFTQVHLSSAMLYALIDLHRLGYIHRFMKPHTFAIGLDEHIKSIFMCDFSLAWKYVDDNGKTLQPRKRVKIMGALRYTSRHSHLHQELSRRDDLESWLYVSIEFFHLRVLPWHGDMLAASVLYKKQKLFDNGYPSIWDKNALQYREIMMYIESLKYSQQPDYNYILALLDKAKHALRADFGRPMDWELMKNKEKEMEVQQVQSWEPDDYTEDREAKEALE